MPKKVLVLASNLGLWGEELQAPWDALKKAGFELTLATEQGKTPLPLMLSIDKTFIDPVQNVAVNPADVVDRIFEILKKNQWNKTKAAVELNISRRNLIRKVAKYGLRKGHTPRV